jgi:hypothetical protein
METITWQIKRKAGFTPNERRKLAQLLYGIGSGGDEFPGDDLLDSAGDELLDSLGRELTDNKGPT